MSVCSLYDIYIDVYIVCLSVHVVQSCAGSHDYFYPVSKITSHIGLVSQTNLLLPSIALSNVGVNTYWSQKWMSRRFAFSQFHKVENINCRLVTQLLYSVQIRASFSNYILSNYRNRKSTLICHNSFRKFILPMRINVKSICLRTKYKSGNSCAARALTYTRTHIHCCVAVKMEQKNE